MSLSGARDKSDAVKASDREGCHAPGNHGRTESEFGFHRSHADGLARTERIDLGLILLTFCARRGVPLDRDDIAAWCGCSSSMIYLIERNALRKLRKRLLFLKDPRLQDMMEEIFYARTPAGRTEAQV